MLKHKHKKLIKLHLHRSSLHFSALALAAVSFMAANEHAIKAYKHAGKEVAAIVQVVAERELPHGSLTLGSPKLPTVSGGT